MKFKTLISIANGVAINNVKKTALCWGRKLLALALTCPVAEHFMQWQYGHAIILTECCKNVIFGNKVCSRASRGSATPGWLGGRGGGVEGLSRLFLSCNILSRSNVKIQKSDAWGHLPPPLPCTPLAEPIRVSQPPLAILCQLLKTTMLNEIYVNHSKCNIV